MQLPLPSDDRCLLKSILTDKPLRTIDAADVRAGFDIDFDDEPVIIIEMRSTLSQS